ncbi:trans-aconitate 2-methyltransferase [Nocardia sp. NPDC004722]
MWDPDKYLAFDDLRARPFFDLVNRVGATQPRRVADLGCGPGNLTVTLGQRWPGAALEAFDSSPEMVAAAKEHGIDATVADVRDWMPAPDTDVVVTNAVLQWVPDHLALLPRWIEALPAGAWFALQVPGNFDAPSHLAIRELAASENWRGRLGSAALVSRETVPDPAGYAAVLTGAGCRVDAWETTYLQPLTGADPVLEWVTGTALRPVRDALDDADWQDFRADLAPILRGAYPKQPDGTTWLPFRRVFAVAHKH